MAPGSDVLGRLLVGIVQWDDLQLIKVLHNASLASLADILAKRVAFNVLGVRLGNI